jgi:hypothetical protein
MMSLGDIYMNINLELDEGASKALSQLHSATGLDVSRIFSYALSLMLWAVKQGSEGRILASVDESKRSYRQLDLAELRKKQRRAA